MQSKKNKVCVLKFGALGDIVRTSYLINAIAVEQNVEITWITKSISISLLKNNPNIKELVDKDLIPMNTLEVVYDQVISLDDEYESAKIASNLRTKSLIGTFIKGDVVKYTEDTSEWFDMGLISKFGKNVADNLKKLNNKSHSDIFKNILHIEKIAPIFYGDKKINSQWKSEKKEGLIYIGFNFFSGERWPSKEIYQDQQILLINLIDNYFNSKNVPHRLVIFSDHTSNTKAGFIKKYCPFVFIYDTSKSVFDFNAALLLCDYVISSDSLGLHLAIANQIPNLSFYGPTSAVEIDTFNKGVKVISTSDDYCSYKSITDNSSLTANRLFSAWKKHFEQINFSVS